MHLKLRRQPRYETLPTVRPPSHVREVLERARQAFRTHTRIKDTVRPWAHQCTWPAGAFLRRGCELASNPFAVDAVGCRLSSAGFRVTGHYSLSKSTCVVRSRAPSPLRSFPAFGLCPFKHANFPPTSKFNLEACLSRLKLLSTQVSAGLYFCERAHDMKGVFRDFRDRELW